MDIRDNIFQLKDTYQKMQMLLTVVKDSNDAITLQDLQGNVSPPLHSRYT